MKPYVYSTAYYMRMTWHSFMIRKIWIIYSMCVSNIAQRQIISGILRNALFWIANISPSTTSFTTGFYSVKALLFILGSPFKPGGFLDPEPLVNRDCTISFETMSIIMSIGPIPTGFSKLLSSRFYTQVVCPQVEYRLAKSLLSYSQLKRLQNTQNMCMLMIYGTHKCSSTKMMLHLADLLTTFERVQIHQASLNIECELFYVLIENNLQMSLQKFYLLQKP